MVKNTIVKVGLSAMLISGIFSISHSEKFSAAVVSDSSQVQVASFGDPGGGTRP